jgi:hypothetical protein
VRGVPRPSPVRCGYTIGAYHARKLQVGTAFPELTVFLVAAGTVLAVLVLAALLTD